MMIKVMKICSCIKIMIRVIGLNRDCFCLACYTGKYPIEPQETIDKFCMEMK
ncbi:MAG: hypothetical protein LLG40_04385 [Deltaproteobacteria bacterium]|nr:hypothetical protein [Deltaproteobacteria bacterium]